MQNENNRWCSGSIGLEDRSFHQAMGARDGTNVVKFITIDGHKENVRSVAPLGGFGNLQKRGEPETDRASAGDFRRVTRIKRL